MFYLHLLNFKQSNNGAGPIYIVWRFLFFVFLITLPQLLLRIIYPFQDYKPT